jgi:hypothetical protein
MQMKKLLLIGIAAAASTAAHAHDSLVPHVHPHEVSALPNLYAMLGAAVVVALGLLVVGKITRG